MNCRNLFCFASRTAVLGAIVLCPAGVSALSFRDVDSFLGAGGNGQLVSQSSPVSGSFSIVAPGDGDTITIKSGYSDSGTKYSDISGFRPGVDTVTSASAYFYVRDDGDPQADRVNITLDNLSFVDNYKITAPVLLGGTLAASLVVQLNSDGRLDYLLTPQGNLDFYVEYARLDVNATLGSVATAVPDGSSTAILLGCGVIALVAVGKNFSVSALTS